MSVCKPSELHEFLRTQGLRAKKGYSQNFLIDGNIVRKIAEEASIDKNDLVIEIGPGPGALTEKLLATGARVVAIEMDKNLSSALNRLQTPDLRLRVFTQDILKFPLQDFLKDEVLNGKKAKVVANLPYHITTPILAKLMPFHETINTLTLMVQKEVAERFVAKANTKNYSSFTIFLKHYSTPRYCFTVEPTCFFPKPSVKSAIVQLSLKQPFHIEKEQTFFHMVREAFHQRRKMLRSSLKKFHRPERIENVLVSLGLNPLARPEELSLEDFYHLHNALH